MKHLKSILPLAILSGFSLQAENQRPNIIWIVAEDMSAHFGYNGETLIKTPNVDKIASEGVVFNRAYVTCPVCSPSRSALITGMHQTSIGAHNHRSSKGENKIYLPENVKTIPEYFRAAGYYVTNQTLRGNKWLGAGKEDYNFVYASADLYNGIDWSERAKGQPFFGQIQLQGGKKRKVVLPTMVNPADVVLPPHYPNDSVLLNDWAAYLNSVKDVDNEVGVVFDRLKKEGLLDNTIVFFITDHGISHARGKQFCYEEGAHIPMVIWGGKYVGKGVRNELVSHIDLAATSLYLAGIEIPKYMEARPLFGKNAKPREFAITARDRCDETVDHIRSVRKGDYLYIRNYLYKRPHLQPNGYKDRKEILVRMRELHQEGKLDFIQESLFAAERPYEELYNLKLDKFQYVNLATDKNLKKVLTDMRATLDKWELETNDKGRSLESKDVYFKEMQFILNSDGNNAPTSNVTKEMNDNMKLMLKWLEEGK